MVIINIEIKNLDCGYNKNIIVQNVNIRIEPGKILSLLGPNGAGKTTLFKSILGVLPVINGNISYDNKDLLKFSKGELAKIIAYVPQSHNTPFAFEVLDVVMMGRTSHLGSFGNPGKKDYDIAVDALEKLKISNLSNRVFTELSGGERQMVMIARALTQQPKFIMLDEPTSSLDFGNQVKVLETIIDLSKNNIGIIMTTHAPDHALLLEGKVILLENDGTYSYGESKEVITEENLSKAYGVKVKVVDRVLQGEKIDYCYPIIKR